MHSFIIYLSNFDYAISHVVQSLGPKWEPVAHFISYGPGAYTIMLPVFFLALLFIKRWRVAGELALVAVISAVALAILKHYFAVARPGIIDPSFLFYESESSFALPSGHALMSMVILGWIALRHPKSPIVVWGASILVLLVGLSRVYLGVHYPSQVVAGWLFGILFLYIFHLIDKRLWAPFQKKFR